MISDDRQRVIAGADLSVAQAGAAALREGEAQLTESTATLRAELGRLETVWTGEHADHLAAGLGETLQRASALSDDLGALTAVAQRHADAVQEIVGGLLRGAADAAEHDADLDELWSSVDDFVRAGGITLGRPDTVTPGPPGPVTLGSLPEG